MKRLDIVINGHHVNLKRIEKEYDRRVNRSIEKVRIEHGRYISNGGTRKVDPVIVSIPKWHNCLDRIEFNYNIRHDTFNNISVDYGIDNIELLEKSSNLFRWALIKILSLFKVKCEKHCNVSFDLNGKVLLLDIDSSKHLVIKTDIKDELVDTNDNGYIQYYKELDLLDNITYTPFRYNSTYIFENRKYKELGKVLCFRDITVIPYYNTIKKEYGTLIYFNRKPYELKKSHWKRL